MALLPKIKLCLSSNCKTLNFYETTGIYNASTNTGGYGTPNVDTTDIETAILTIISPDNVSYVLDMFSTGDFPSDNIDFYYTIDLNDLNRTYIEDGFWQFIYTVTTNTTTYTTNTSYYFYCNAECCVSKLLSNINIETNGIDKTNINKVNIYKEASIFLESLKNAAQCFNQPNFDSINKILLKICKNSSCKTCN